MGFQKANQQGAFLQFSKGRVVGAAHTKQSFCSLEGCGTCGQLGTGGFIGFIGKVSGQTRFLLNRDRRASLDQGFYRVRRRGYAVFARKAFSKYGNVHR